MMKNDFTLPDRVFFFNHREGPMYRDGVIYSAFPFSRKFSIGKLKKTARESLPIHLHELAHQIFKETIQEGYQDRPEVIWAFFMRDDPKGLDEALSLIQRTKGRTRFEGLSDQAIQEHFSKLSITGEAYNELFADTVPVFFTGNPDAMFTNIHFNQVAEQGNDVEKAFEKNHELRRFGLVNGNWKLGSAGDANSHDLFAETRSWIWQNLYQDYWLERHPDMPPGKILKRIMLTLVESFEEVTRNFEINGQERSISEMNQNLIRALRKNFREP